MKIFICTSKHFYHKISDIKLLLEKEGHIITLPNSFDDPFQEERISKQGQKEHIKVKQEWFRSQIEKVSNNDAILVLNERKGDIDNYVGGSVLLEMYEAWRENKKIFMFNSIPETNLKDEIIGLNPIILNGDLTKIK